MDSNPITKHTIILKINPIIFTLFKLPPLAISRIKLAIIIGIDIINEYVLTSFLLL